MRAAPNPRTLTGWSGASPHVLRFPCGLSSGFPFARQVLPPSPAFLWFPFVRRSPVWSLRPLPGSGSPSVSLRVPFPLSNVHVSAAAGRFRRRWSWAAGTKVTSPAATTPLWIARSARTADGQRLGTMGSRHRIACYERPRAQDIAAPEPPRSSIRRISRVGDRRAITVCDETPGPGAEKSGVRRADPARPKPSRRMSRACLVAGGTFLRVSVWWRVRRTRWSGRFSGCGRPG